MRSVPPLPSTPQRACTMESAAKPSHATTMFWFCFAMFGPPILALCVRAVWTAVGAEPAHGVAVDLPSALPSWSRSPEVITAGLGLTVSHFAGALGLVGFVTLLRRPLTLQ